jgi:hypothetical protein
LRCLAGRVAGVWDALGSGGAPDLPLAPPAAVDAHRHAAGKGDLDQELDGPAGLKQVADLKPCP